MQQYVAASAALNAKNYGASRADSQALVDYCAAANQTLAAQAAAAPQVPSTPIPMTSYHPVPLATLGPDPALAQTPAPMPTATPPARQARGGGDAKGRG
jgi:hypothetical protein